MTNQIDVDRFFSQFDDTRKQASVDAVFGTPIESDGRIVIPIASATYGFGLGVGVGESSTSTEGEEVSSGSGGGGGGGYIVRPLAVAVIDRDGVRIDPIVNEERLALAGILMGAWSVFWLGRVLLRFVSGKRKWSAH